MDPRRNPFSPGAGSQPPELAGRDDIVEKAAIALDRIRSGRSARSLILYGLRGVGKTVLLNRIRNDAEARGFATVHIEAPENRSLPAILVPSLRSLLVRLSTREKTKEKAQQALRILSGFARALKVKYQDIEVVLDVPSELGRGDSGDLEFDLRDLLEAVGQAAQANDSAAVIFIDELQYVKVRELEVLIAALHSISQKKVPITMVAAGLPQLLGQMGKAKSYAERLFEFVQIDKLARLEATDALVKPARSEDVEFDTYAVDSIIDKTEGYPYFLQEWGKHSWDLAEGNSITYKDVERAEANALAELDRGFFRVRFDRLTPSEKIYMRAMATLGPGPHRSGDVASKLKKKVTTVAPVRNNLIAKGMAYSPAHGDIAFTVPMFDGFLKRTLPEK
jgi:AAA+ ATPase superfamily predicted ATPase